MRSYEIKVQQRVLAGHTVYYRVRPAYKGQNPILWAVEVQAVDATGWHFDVFIENSPAGRILGKTEQNVR